MEEIFHAKILRIYVNFSKNKIDFFIDQKPVNYYYKNTVSKITKAMFFEILKRG